MTPTDTSEKEFETIIVNSLVNDEGYIQGNSNDYDRDHAVDFPKLLAFLNATQPGVVTSSKLNEDGPDRRAFLNRLRDAITKNGVIHLLRNPLKHGPASVDLYYAVPTPGNTKAEEQFAANIFSVTRQLRYSKNNPNRSIDMCIFINGLPIATLELKNKLTGQNVNNAIKQYKDRQQRELLFKLGRCVVHFAVDDHEIMMCTHLEGKKSWFLPFNKGLDDGAGNPPNPGGIATDYLWKQFLTKDSLTDILENYAQLVVEEREKREKKRKQIFPRYHQLDLVRKLLADAAKNGVGKRYLIQHSAGSGKSNSIAWLAHQLIGLETNDKTVFDSIIVVTDRNQLDRQIRDTIKQFAQVSSTLDHAKNSRNLLELIEKGKKIIITTIQKFPFILDEIGDEHRGRKFAIIIDEAHSSQGGRTAVKMNVVCSPNPPKYGETEDEKTSEDIINDLMESKKMLSNASYFAFTATPKNKTLEIFGEPFQVDDKIKHRAFHTYSMKQAIQEGFIMDVLKNYTPVESYYRLAKIIDDDPEFDKKKAQKKLRKFVESDDYSIQKKAKIMIDHFHRNVIGHKKVGGKARAMVVTGGIQRAIQYFKAFKAYLKKIDSPYKAIVAFSGEHEYGEEKFTESKYNIFPSKEIPKKFIKDPYRFLIVAEKFQTGYDEPLLHTMYVEKVLSGIKAVQTLSRLNRAHPDKHDTFILDFVNNTETIAFAFNDYYRTTILSEKTDPNKLHDTKSDLDAYHVYEWTEVDELVNLYLSGASRERLDPILDRCVVTYMDELEEDGQIDFKSKAKSFCRSYNFLASILPYNNAEWEKLSIFLNFLIPKLPAPREDDFSKGILEAIDLDSYRVEVKATRDISLEDTDAEIGPVPTSSAGGVADPEMERLSAIIKEFNDLLGNIPWTDKDKVLEVLSKELPEKVAADEAYKNAMRNSDLENAKLEHKRALEGVMFKFISIHSELYKEFSDNEDFRRRLEDMVFRMTYRSPRDMPPIQDRPNGAMLGGNTNEQ